MPDTHPVPIEIQHRILFHPQALHVRRMRFAVWLYLALLAMRPRGCDTFEIDPAGLASAMGLPEGTVRSWLGHLRKHRYIEASGRNGTVTVRIKHADIAPEPEAPAPNRFFTVAKLTRALGEDTDRQALVAVLERCADEPIRRALAQTLAVPQGQIRRSRTALFLYLIKRHDDDTSDDSCP